MTPVPVLAFAVPAPERGFAQGSQGADIARGGASQEFPLWGKCPEGWAPRLRSETAPDFASDYSSPENASKSAVRSDLLVMGFDAEVLGPGNLLVHQRPL